MIYGLPATPSVNYRTEPPARKRSWMPLGVGIVAAVGAAALFALGLIPRLAGEAELTAEQATRDAPRQVTVVRPEAAGDDAVTLPATAQADRMTEVFARVDGYVKTWKVDLGGRVRAGDVLAEIDTPELDRETEQAVALLEEARAAAGQARAELDEAKADVKLAEANAVRAQANLDFARTQLQRISTLTRSGSGTREELDSTTRDRDARKADLDAAAADLARRRSNLATREAVIASRDAAIRSREAAVARLRQLQQFKTVTAPFEGVVARRNTEVGMLVTAGSSGTKPLFGVVRDDVLRVQVPVPQSFAAPLRVGDRAEVMIPEHPGRVFAAQITRTAGAVDPASRTLLTELELPNAEHVLLPGTFAEVRLMARRTDGAVKVPSNVLLMRTDGPHVAVVQSDETLRLRKVRLGRDHGTAVEVVAGLKADEAVVLNPSDTLRDGERVETSRPESRVAAKH
jgi:multidrug efflux pump subunit AcrA (membrane-fusion protein)